MTYPAWPAVYQFKVVLRGVTAFSILPLTEGKKPRWQLPQEIATLHDASEVKKCIENALVQWSCAACSCAAATTLAASTTPSGSPCVGVIST